MKNLAIRSGAFTEAGNFTGYTILGERVHIYGRQLEAIGFKSNADVKFPFFVISEEKEYSVMDADGNPTDKTFKRNTALSAFATKESMIEAHSEAAMLDVEVSKAVKQQATAAGLTEAEIKVLLAEA